MDFTKRKHEMEESSLSAWPIEGLEEILLWRNWLKTAIIFSVTFMFLLDMRANSIISVISVAGVVILLITMSYCGYVWGMRKITKSTDTEHPYQHYLDMDIAISNAAAERLARFIVLILNAFVKNALSLMIVEEPLDSLKLLLIFGALNIIGDYINGMTVILVGFVLLFTLPKLYEWKKPFVDAQLKKLQQLKSQWSIGNKKKKPHVNTAPTVAVDPQIISSSGQRPKYNGNCNEYNENQFETYDDPDATLQNYDSEYIWPEAQDLPPESYQHTKDQ